jgi:ubiquinone/menaquinone biosynthesis C-methylase UbiE
MLSAQDWHLRFLLQARWTDELRRHLARELGFDRAERILEVGCGTGVITGALCERTRANLHGLDIDEERLGLAQSQAVGVCYTCGDGLSLPYAAGSFDATVCHFFLLWASDAAKALAEMRRVTRPGGWVVAMAEPDYGGRIDSPAELEAPGRLQTAALSGQGADPYIGRRLAGLFAETGLRNVHFGLLGGNWSGALSPSEAESEWAILRSDLKELASLEQMERWRLAEARAAERGERVLFVPTFYAWGEAV